MAAQKRSNPYTVMVYDKISQTLPRQRIQRPLIACQRGNRPHKQRYTTLPVTNTPDLVIDPDDDDDDLELYGAPVRPPVKPRFIDVARLANAWCQHYLETAQRGIGENAEPQNVVKAEDDGHQDLAYPSPPPLYERFDPVFYPTPWDNNPVPIYLRDEPPRGRHEETIVEPQNEAGPSRHTDEATPEARGNSPPWCHLPGGFYKWYKRPGCYEEDERPGYANIMFDEESERRSNEDEREETPERENNEDDDTNYLVTRTRRYKRGS
jgi:hypothetical protein